MCFRVGLVLVRINAMFFMQVTSMNVYDYEHDEREMA